MPTTYSLAIPGDEVLDLLAEAMAEWHPTLRGAGVKVGVLRTTNPDGDALVKGGLPVIATAQVQSHKNRVSKHYDAELSIDESHWNASRDGQRLALLDGLLACFELVPLPRKELSAARHNDPDAPWWRLDDQGRPRLRRVKEDLRAGFGFRGVVVRHGDDAPEFVTISSAYAAAYAARDEKRKADRLAAQADTLLSGLEE